MRLASGAGSAADRVVHLAAAVSRECEADLDLGMRPTSTPRSRCSRRRASRETAAVRLRSSIAVFGGTPGQPLPDVIEDGTLPTPQSSYGIQKFIGEQLVADFARRGFVRGRSVRLMTVAVRPGRPNGAASGFLSGMIREPLAGQRAPCRSRPNAGRPGLAGANGRRPAPRAQAGDAKWGPRTGLNLPALSTSVGEIAAALERVVERSPRPARLGRPTRPSRLVGPRPATRRGAGPAACARRRRDFDAVHRGYAREHPDAVELPGRA